MKQLSTIAAAGLLALAMSTSVAAAEQATKPTTGTTAKPTGLETRVEKKLLGRSDSWQRFEPPRPLYRDRSEKLWRPSTGDIKLRRAGD
ncbi:hypothetical protein [Oleomonas cavernae]|nr:hypothetical protein [Oleomonas cavernae]